MSTDIKCPIWGTKATEHDADGEDGRRIDSPRAGGCYFISTEAEEMLKDCDASVKARLTTWLNDQRRLGVDCPKVDARAIKDSRKRRLLPVYERADRLLRFLESYVRHPGSGYPVPYKPTDHKDFYLALSWVESSVNSSYIKEQKKEIKHFMKHLEQRGWISIVPPKTMDSSRDYRLTVDGYARLAEGRHISSDRAFVAMWLGASMDEAFEQGIKPGIQDAGYEPIRIDQKDHINKIDDEIIAEIRRSRFVVADFTHGREGARGSVYYEAGFAMGLGIPVIYCCRKGMEEKLHFDTRQYNHILWESADELRRQLAKRIAAGIGDGPHKKPPDRDPD